MSKKPKQKKKKQHFVPQCYLEAWAIPNKYQVNVYDRVSLSPYPASICDVAEENYFYDINFSKALSKAEQQQLGLSPESLQELSDEQFFENFFADDVEGDFARLLNKIRDAASTLTPWRANNCYFISEEDKHLLSCHLALQRLRTKSARNSITQMSDCLSQMFADMGASPEAIKDLVVTKDSVKLIHGRMMVDYDELTAATTRIQDFIWILGVNNTCYNFITSDSPFGTVPHLRNNYVSMSGLMSQGVEAFFPISPKLILVMFDRAYHQRIADKDRHYISFDKPEIVQDYNRMCVEQCSRCVYSIDDDFSFINKMLQENPEALNGPNVTATWNGKIYTARKNKN